MDERRQDNPEQPRRARRAAIVAGPPDHPTARALAAALREAGWSVAEGPNVYELTVALAGSSPLPAVAALAVDFCNHDELRFFTLAKRRWPHLRTVAVAQPAFAFKAAMADLAGADALCADPSRAAEVALGLELHDHTQPDRLNTPGATAAPFAAVPPPPEKPTAIRDSIRVAASSHPTEPDTSGCHTQAPLGGADGHAPAETIEAFESDELTDRPAPPRRPPEAPVQPANQPHGNSPREILTAEELAALLEDFNEDEDETK